ncbi:MAG: SsrA-binding protein SmpB [Candidatus Manganitrophus sp.]|uniref:SsrA-binding protein n=1 Tax=Candidatus Manganitrophus noduliformans TaxID=2606439 RepID=A0A7X6DLQ5_9BACT|nr:SsrA-binding protein SmpB [Candidatus Manganitrophus noduliformans]MCG3114355.1 SsrA-binding protein SmpB [Candidatus Manganitrophus morganii]MDC4205175.1 SsrA-binding protein SmpB [Candidatus Manganitrophus sp.]NKE69510.1 SsrA-binding protein SmpB [Candidatus Manganitrophus noduliformans]WDT70165.1 MAG: SsrA-binding protein SmpB [Candidatus Manganitrophus sp.]WDT77561.1 MAG: SsrA-binding protein SmpB [Candidatus Manganitrophus sp.]
MAVEKENDSLVVSNRKAFHDYFIEETLEAGIVLAGTEVKSLREGRINLKDSFARVENGEVLLYNCHISPYSHGNISNHDPTRTRKLLLQRREIERLLGKAQQKGYTLVPLKIYFKRGWAKVEIGLAVGKKLYDKRETESKKSAQREIEKAVRGKRQDKF